MSGLATDGVPNRAGGPFSGQTDYYRVELRASQYYNTFETLNQVLSFIGRAGVIDSYGDSDRVPYFDRMFLGGPSSLRGFEFREVGPKDTVGLDTPLEDPDGPSGAADDPDGADVPPTYEPIGGSTYAMGSIEYTFEVVNPLRLAVFYDVGFVNVDAWDFETSGYNDNFGFGIRLMVGGAPLSLDFGLPITTDEHNDDGLQFNFSFGTRF